MAPLRPRYRRIERIVNELLATHTVSAAPVPIEPIVRSRGIKLYKGNLKDVSGMIVRQGDVVTIGVNETQHPTRQRFTIAHEFGHFLLHEGMPVRYDHNFRVNLRSDKSSQGVDVEEIEANFFAASILMPRQFLEKDYEGHVVDIDDPGMASAKDLAKQYKVSPQAMSNRLINLFGMKADLSLY